MSLLGKIENINNSVELGFKIEDIENLLERNYSIHRKFKEDIIKFIDEYNKVAKEKNIATDLVTLDGMLFLKDLVEINYSMCFDDFDSKSLSILPLFFISFEKSGNVDNLKKIIPNIYNFAEEIEAFLECHNIAYGEYVIFGEKRFVSSDLEVSRFVSVEDFKKIIDDAEKLLNKNLSLFIEDLENFVISKAYSLTLPEIKEVENKKVSFLNKAIINVENYLSELKEDDIKREEINEIIDFLELLKEKEGNI